MSDLETAGEILRAEPSRTQLSALTPLQEPLLRLQCDKLSELLKMREKYRHPKDKEFTDLDRKTMLDSHTAELQAEFDYIKGVVELINERIVLIREFYANPKS